jgi:hypothetical protein
MPITQTISRTNPCSEPTNASIYTILQQRRQRALYYVPPMRLNLNSPYPTFTKMQIDMRRKVEVLKYKNQNSQTNNLTNAQKWSQLVSGNSPYSISQNTALTLSQTDDLTCASDSLIPTLTTACDVPGPPMYLTYDPNVPLYNYSVNNLVSAISSIPDNSLWKIYTRNEITFLQQKELTFYPVVYPIPMIEMELGVIIITNNISSPTTAYTINTPIAIWISGIFLDSGVFDDNTKTYSVPRPRVSQIKVSISEILLNIYYSGKKINTYPISNSYNGIDTSFNLTSVLFDPNETYKQTFYAIQYVGMLAIPTFILTTQANNIYTLSLSFTYNFTDTTTGREYDFTANPIAGFDAGVFCNLSSINQNIYANPTTSEQNSAIKSLPSRTPYSSGSFVNLNIPI